VVVDNGWVASFAEGAAIDPEADVVWHETDWPRTRNEASLQAWVKHNLKPTVGDLGRKEAVRLVIASKDLWTDIHTPSDPEEDPLTSTKRFLGRRLPYPPDRIDVRVCPLGERNDQPILFVVACRTGMLRTYTKAFAAWGVPVVSIEPAMLHALQHQRAVLNAQGLNRARYITEAGDHALTCEWDDGLPQSLRRRGPSPEGTNAEHDFRAADGTESPTIIDAPNGWWDGASVGTTHPAAAPALRRPWTPTAASRPAPSTLAWQAAAGGHTG